MGKQHSQGGHSLTSLGLELNMLSFNKILSIDRIKKQVTVESGITWVDLQQYINPYNLAIQSMQSPNIFTVGGSISVNAHGDDFRTGSVGNSLVSFHLIMANGKKLLVTPKTEPFLWNTVIGGYGLLGVITDVTLQLTDNNLLKSHYNDINLKNFPSYFKNHILNDPDVNLFYAHLNIVPGTEFLKKMYGISYTNTHQLPQQTISLENPDKWNVILTNLFNLSRKGHAGKDWRWRIEKKVLKKYYSNHIVTRNNAMQKPIRFASNYLSPNDVDWLQEYFIPSEHLLQFIKKLRHILIKNKINILNVTIRYVPADPDVLLTYSKSARFAVVLYFNQDLSSDEIRHTQLWTQQLINDSISLGGTYYLPYQPFASKQQFYKSYIRFEEFLKIKQKYDPTELFNSHFYQNYFKNII
jgi:FAD/FMN-containing dehydrogenase